ncbi:hypothetical protein MTO96_030133 [Rhipicephalus appendiculatus]
MTYLSILRHNRTEMLEMLASDQQRRCDSELETLRQPKPSLRSSLKNVRDLMSYGSRTLNLTVTGMAAYIMSNQAAREISMGGRKGKLKFRELKFTKIVFFGRLADTPPHRVHTRRSCWPDKGVAAQDQGKICSQGGMMGCRVVLLIEAGSPRLSLSDGHTSMESAPPGCSSLLVPCEDAGLLRGGWLLGTVNEVLELDLCAYRNHRRCLPPLHRLRVEQHISPRLLPACFSSLPRRINDGRSPRNQSQCACRHRNSGANYMRR